MWRIRYIGCTVEEVLIMAYMNILEAKACTQVSGSRQQLFTLLSP